MQLLHDEIGHIVASDLSARLRASGLNVPEDAIWTSALATAAFLKSQIPGGSAFVIGEAGITTALHEAGFIMTETNPDYVVVGASTQQMLDAGFRQVGRDFPVFLHPRTSEEHALARTERKSARGPHVRGALIE